MTPASNLRVADNKAMAAKASTKGAISRDGLNPAFEHRAPTRIQVHVASLDKQLLEDETPQ